MPGVIAGQCLPAPDDDIDIAGIELDGITAPPDPFRGDDGRATTAEGIEHQVAAGRAIHDGVGH